MAYDHITVRSIERNTESTIKRMAERISTQSADTQADLATRTEFVDGVRVTKRCAEFAAEVRKVYRNIKFGVSRDCESEWVGGIVAHCAMHAYLPGQEYAMCKFGYANVGVTGTQHRWFVAARTIRNEKFAEHRDQYYMAMSEKLDRAVVALKKHVRPYTPMECAQITYDSFASNVRNKSWSIRSGADDARRVLFEGDDFRDELFGMLVRGYEFNNPLIKEKLMAWQTKHNEMVEHMSKAVHCYYVQARMMGDEQVFEILEVFDVKSNSIKGSAQGVQTFKASDLPSDIGHKLAALSMLENGSYIPELGMKASDTTYWVERN